MGSFLSYRIVGNKENRPKHTARPDTTIEKYTADFVC
ncbi:hypothetical protein Clocel_3882 [Clostridium cellulovorans 743B]|uniref:Uncharacterized protein n=1 Tax=Clostridium cellulovorans (strain ATCC 35296 / DSM 3052 / OCM 3 / 743B) TaxID=573061 RepID=D9SKX6_CLOC7|nr:hypothetical protein Clocel_3882 [Clostridium cellulovorans 743B]